MKSTIDKFQQIVNNLLDDESKKPMAQFIASENLYAEVDLALSKTGIDEDKFEAALNDLVLKTPRTATKTFSSSCVNNSSPFLINSLVVEMKQRCLVIFWL